MNRVRLRCIGGGRHSSLVDRSEFISNAGIHESGSTGEVTFSSNTGSSTVISLKSVSYSLTKLYLCVLISCSIYVLCV